MKVLQLAALFGAAVSAVDPLIIHNGVRRDVAETTTQVVLVTSLNVHTTLCSNAPDCPAGATVLVTSTTVVASTTTICSTPGAVFPPPEASSAPMDTPVRTSAFPTVHGPPSVTPGLPVGPSGSAGSSVVISIGSQSLGFTISIIPGSSVESTVSVVPPTPSGSGYLPPVASSVVSTGLSSVPVSSGQLPSDSTSSSASHSTSFPSAPPIVTPGVPSSTRPDAVSSSAGPSSPAGPSSSAEGTSSGMYTSGLSSSAGQSYGPSVGISVGISVGVSASPSAAPSGPSGSSSTISSATVAPSATGPSASAILSASGSSASALPSAFGPSSSAGPYSPSAPDTISTTRQGPPGTASEYSSTLTSGSTTASRPTLRSTTSDVYGPPTPPAESESPVNSTVRVTSYFTKTMTSVITPGPVSGAPNSTYPVTISNIEATDISRGTSASAYPSGSGYAQPSGNSTIVSPRPTYSEVPINMGQVIGAGKSSLAAIVVALVFAHFA